MKFLVDAQLPRRLAGWLTDAGHAAIHTLDLPDGNRTTDAEICTVADRDGRAVITKDADFVNSHLVEGRPTRLLLVSTGNIGNADLQRMIYARLPDIVEAFSGHRFIELTTESLVIHE